MIMNVNDRHRQLKALLRPRKVTVSLSEECKRYLDAEKEEIIRTWRPVSMFHHMKLSKTALCRMLKQHGCKNLGYSIASYCCYGMGRCCWIDSSDDGWLDDTSTRAMFKAIRESIRDMRPYLKNPERVFWYRHRCQDEDVMVIYIFLRDTYFKFDYSIWWTLPK